MNEAMWEDLGLGYLYGLSSCAVIGWWSLALASVTAVLWMAGGMGFLGTNFWRRIFMPVLLCGIFFWVTKSGWVLVSLPLQITWLYQGYSVPDVNQPKASWLGRIFGKWTKTVWLGVLMVAMIPMLIK